MNARQHVQLVIKQQGVAYNDDAYVLANGGTSKYFIDIKQAFADGRDMLFLAHALQQCAIEHDIQYNVIGGMELGAVPIAVAMAMYGEPGSKWFAVRKRNKLRGTNKLIEGYMPGKYDNVLIVEDVVTTGTTVLRTYDHLKHITNVAGVISVVDRSNHQMDAQALQRDIKYAPLFTTTELL